MIIFGPSGGPNAPPLLDSLVPYVKPIVTNLGVRIDRHFTLDKQINSVVKSSFFQLRILAKVKPFLSFNDFERVIHCFISTKLDYCNALYIGVNKTSLSRLQLVQDKDRQA